MGLARNVNMLNTRLVGGLELLTNFGKSAADGLISNGDTKNI